MTINDIIESLFQENRFTLPIFIEECKKYNINHNEVKQNKDIIISIIKKANSIIFAERIIVSLNYLFFKMEDVNSLKQFIKAVYIYNFNKINNANLCIPDINNVKFKEWYNEKIKFNE